MSGIVSHACRSLFLDYLLSESSLGEIQRAFEASGIMYVDNGFGHANSKRRLVQGYFLSIDWNQSADVVKFLEVISFYMTREETRGISFAKEHPVSRFIKSLKMCGFEFRDGKVIAFSHSARLADAKAMATTLDLPHLEDHIRRIETSIDADPALAIGSAKEMVETVCKTILTKRASASGIIYSKEDDLNELGKKAFSVLRQLPDDIPDRAKGAKTIKTMLSNLRSVVQCTAELRNWYGNGHGREGDIKRGLSPRHARLVVGAASTLSWYLLETDRDMG
ncbi:abortive infection family protein [Gluconobacter albidus]|uniref:abortive infection family protein n=1 Tax=Gluconobacter albidus TaxID=318683 RepID=UPI00209CD52D|nr:abortive infection family protein [Gluconobacter albidus]MCP1272349.1 abortive infection family protein [Gluconobacter albidus]